MEHNRHILILTGEVSEGKTSFMEARLEELRGKIRLAGFTAPGSVSRGQREAFRLRRVDGKEEVVLAGRKAFDGALRCGRFFFHAGAFETGKSWVREAMAAGTDLLVMDEVGPLELEGRGWYPLLEELAGRRDQKSLWVVRRSSVEAVCRRWQIPRANILGIGEREASEVTQKILQHVIQNEGPAPG